MPGAPGTVGTLVAILPCLLFSRLALPYYLLIILLGFGMGVFICHYTSNELGVHDHSGIVWDEFVGFWITMLAVPPKWPWILIGFVLFRLFDILKPWPIDIVDVNLQGGLGIMMDDALAGGYALLCLQIVLHLMGHATGTHLGGKGQK